MHYRIHSGLFETLIVIDLQSKETFEVNNPSLKALKTKVRLSTIKYKLLSYYKLQHNFTTLRRVHQCYIFLVRRHFPHHSRKKRDL